MTTQEASVPDRVAQELQRSVSPAVLRPLVAVLDAAARVQDTNHVAFALSRPERGPGYSEDEWKIFLRGWDAAAERVYATGLRGALDELGQALPWMTAPAAAPDSIPTYIETVNALKSVIDRLMGSETGQWAISFAEDPHVATRDLFHDALDLIGLDSPKVYDPDGPLKDLIEYAGDSLRTAAMNEGLLESAGARP